MKSILSKLLLIVLPILAIGCAHTAPQHVVETPNGPVVYQGPVDPFEKLNRIIFAFDMDLDHLVLRPVATVYATVVPSPVRRGVTNVFANVDEIVTFPNDILQGKFKFAMVDVCRFMVNTSFGVGGIFDVATTLGLPEHSEDFGLTLAYWRGGPSAYVVLPLLGPSTVADSIGLGFDYLASPWPYVRPWWITYAAWSLDLTNERSTYLSADKLLDESFDPYIFLRSAYLQKRYAQIEANKLPYRTLAERRASGEH